MTINQAKWEKENRRLKNQQRKMEKRGYTFPKPLYYTDRPKRVTKKALENIKNKRGDEYYRNAEYIVRETGEVISGLEGRKLEKQRAYIKSKAKKGDNDSYAQALNLANKIEKKYGVEFYEIVGTPDDILEIQTEEQIDKEWLEMGVDKPPEEHYEEIVEGEQPHEKEYAEDLYGDPNDVVGDLKYNILQGLLNYIDSLPPEIGYVISKWWKETVEGMEEEEVIERLSNMPTNLIEYVHGGNTMYEAMEKFVTDFLNILPLNNETREELEGMFDNEQY